jgi:hypothetical protein
VVRMALVAGRLAGTSPPGGAQRLVAKRLFMRSWLKGGPGLLVPVLLASSVVAGCPPRIDGTASWGSLGAAVVEVSDAVAHSS